jgi:trk system potassium uptake protein TrkH
MINKKVIFRIIGILVLLETMMMLACMAVSNYYGEDDLLSFAATAGITLIAGSALLFIGRGAKRQLSRRDGIIVVSLSWVVVSAFGMLPFIFSGYIPKVSDAFFETMSGFTSTGATILDNVEALPHGLLFWRAFTQWVGGLGIVFFTLAVLPIFGVGGVQLFAAEASTASHDKVHPRIGITARWIWSIYLGLTVTVIILLLLGGMPMFDSVCHAFATTSTGGFSTKNASIAYYHSPYIEYVIAIFMTLCGVNFTLLLLLTKRQFKKFFRDTELKWYLISVASFTLIIAAGLYHTTNMNPEEAFRTSFFQVASLHTSTGLITSDYMTWTPVLWCMLPILMVVGGCAGSTSGGIKCIRMVIMSKVAQNEFKRIVHPNAVLPVRVNKQVIPTPMLTSALAFIVIYIMIIVVSILFMMSFNMSFLESIGTTISSLGNMGPGLGLTGPAYSWSVLPDEVKWLCSFLMLMGRLELFTVLILFTGEFWKRR